MTQLTKREQFAAAALEGILAAKSMTVHDTRPSVAKNAFEWADAMIEAGREKSAVENLVKAVSLAEAHGNLIHHGSNYMVPKAQWDQMMTALSAVNR